MKHLFTFELLYFSAKQKKQLEQHRNIYESINSYSQEISAAGPDLNPLSVFKSAILMQQRQPRTASANDSPKAVPVVQPTLELHQRQDATTFDKQLESLRHILPDASTVKLVALLAEENGNMNSVVQRILDSAEKEEEDGRIIDLTVEESPPPKKGTTSTCTTTLDVSQVSIETDVLKSILANVNQQKKSSNVAAPINLLTFQRPELNTSMELAIACDSSLMLSDCEALRSPSPFECPYCFKELTQKGHFCQFCGALLQKTYLRW